MFDFEITTDLSAVQAILAHPKLYSLMADDFMPPRELFQVPPPGAITYVLVKRAGERMGIVLVVRRNQLYCELHVCILPTFWGWASVKAARQFFPWFWAHFSYLRAVGNIPSCNKAALSFAELCRLERFGTNRGVFQKGGRLYDEVWVGIDRPVMTT